MDLGCQKAAAECMPSPNSGDFRFRCPKLKLVDQSRFESEYVDSFIPNELLVGKKLHPKKLHPLIALLLFLEKLKALWFPFQKEVKFSLCLDSFFLLLYKTRGRVFSN